jgi:hypothetical protein
MYIRKALKIQIKTVYISFQSRSVYVVSGKLIPNAIVLGGEVLEELPDKQRLHYKT